MQQPIRTKLAAEAVGPYTQGIVYGNLLYVSGQIGLTPISPILPENFEEEVKNALFNVKSIIEASGSRLGNCMKVSVFLTDMKNFAEMNTIYAKFFTGIPPARECVGVASLPKNARVEFSAIAFVREDQ